MLINPTRVKFREVKKNQIPRFELGGIIAGGVAHAEKNKLGDKGIPVVDSNNFYKKGGRYSRVDKLAEVESEEIVFNLETAQKIENLVDKYLSCKCESVLLDLGYLAIDALKKTKDETCRTGCKFSVNGNVV